MSLIFFDIATESSYCSWLWQLSLTVVRGRLRFRGEAGVAELDTGLKAQAPRRKIPYHRAGLRLRE